MAVSRSYVLSTLGYGIVGVLGGTAGLFFLIQGRWMLALICAAILYVSADNVFCSDRICRAGGMAKGKYSVPPLFRKKGL